MAFARGSDLTLLFVAMLATWRCTAMIVFDRGPFGVFIVVRRALVRAGGERLITCFHCSAIWVAAGVVAAVYAPSVRWALLIPAIGGGASWLELQLQRTRVVAHAPEEISDE